MGLGGKKFEELLSEFADREYPMSLYQRECRYFSDGGEG